MRLWFLQAYFLLFQELFELLVMVEVIVYHRLETLKGLAGIYIYYWIVDPGYSEFRKVQSMLVFLLLCFPYQKFEVYFPLLFRYFIDDHLDIFFRAYRKNFIELFPWDFVDPK